MQSGTEPLASRSWNVVARFCIKLGIFVIVCGLQVALGGFNPFFLLTALSAALCVILAVRAGEHPLGRSLTYWDEAAMFGLLSQLG